MAQTSPGLWMGAKWRLVGPRDMGNYLCASLPGLADLLFRLHCFELG
uniref:Uncharacterized protein n=1 Tax=Triticum urartu TaxID=4572 RepID=A0A8R7QZS3_TRIUA